MSAPTGTSTVRGRVSIVLLRDRSWRPDPTERPAAPGSAVREPAQTPIDPPATAEVALDASEDGEPEASALDPDDTEAVGPNPDVSEDGEIDPLDRFADDLDFDDAGAPAHPTAPSRPVVAVVGLAPRSGASTVARWVGAALALRDPAGAAIVSTASPRGTGALRTSGAARLARGLEARSLEPVRAAGRLCLVDAAAHSPLSIAATYLAPLVLDVGHGTPAEPALSVADHVLLVASPAVEPALAEVVAESIVRVAPEPTVVLTRAVEDARWDGRADIVLPESRIAARRASAGRGARGEVGTAISDLAAGLEGALWR